MTLLGDRTDTIAAVGVAAGESVGVGVAGTGVGEFVGAKSAAGELVGVAVFSEPDGVLPQAVQDRIRTTISNSEIIFVFFMIISLLYQNSAL